MLRFSLLIVAAHAPLACGFHGALSTSDAPATSDAVLGDASPTDCWPLWQAHTPVLAAPAVISELSTVFVDRDPSLSADGLMLYFSSNRPSSSASMNAGEYDIWYATRVNATAAWNSPVLDVGLSSALTDTKVSFDSTGLIAAIASTRAAGTIGGGGASNTGQGGSDIWLASRTDTASDFANISEAELAAIDDASDQYDPALSGDGLRLYFSPFAQGAQVLAMAQRTSTAKKFGAPTTLNVVATAADPALSPDELVLFYTADNDIWYATRADTNSDFAQPTKVPIVNTAAAEGDAMPSGDGCTLFFAGVRSMTDATDYDLLSAAVSN